MDLAGDEIGADARAAVVDGVVVTYGYAAGGALDFDDGDVGAKGVDQLGAEVVAALEAGVDRCGQVDAVGAGRDLCQGDGLVGHAAHLVEPFGELDVLGGGLQNVPCNLPCLIAHLAGSADEGCAADREAAAAHRADSHGRIGVVAVLDDDAVVVGP